MKVKFIPQNIEVEVSPDKTLLQIANENNIEIKSICKGVPSCAECRVNIAKGEHNIVPPSKAELSLIGTSYYIDSRRLSCQVRCFGDVTVDLTEQVERAANQVKKVRGFRPSKAMESRAVQDTMILNEKMEVEKPSHQGVSSSEAGADSAEAGGATEKPQNQNGNPRSQQNARGQQNQKSQQNNKQQNNQNRGQQRPQQKGQNQPKQGQGQGQGGQQQGQGRQQQQPNQQGKGKQKQGGNNQQQQPQQPRNSQGSQSAAKPAVPKDPKN